MFGISQVSEVLTKAWGASKNIIPLLPSIMEMMGPLFESKEKERKSQMNGILGRGFTGMKDVLQIYAQQSQGIGDLAIITESLFEDKGKSTIFDTLSLAYMIIEKVPFLGSYIEGMIPNIPGFMECAGFMDILFGTTFKKDIEQGDGEAASQVIKMMLQIGDLIMTQVNMHRMKDVVQNRA